MNLTTLCPGNCRLPMLMILIVIAFPVMLSAQNENGRRPANRMVLQQHGTWYDSSTAVLQIRYPIIRNIPPISTGQPYQVLLDYIYLDSAMRAGREWTLRRSINSWTGVNDTMTALIQVCYRLADYNPIIFAQYLAEANGLRYRTSGTGVVSDLHGKFLSTTTAMRSSRAYFSAMEPEYILRVEVVGIDAAPYKAIPHGYWSYRVLARVIDTLKGEVFSSAPCEHSATNCSLIWFHFVPVDYWAPASSESSDPDLYQHRDSAFMDPSGGFTMRAGQQAIVFLSHENKIVDSSYDYFDLSVQPRASYNALPIIDGQVRDVNHIWSDSTMLPYEEWKSRFMKIKNGILTRSY